MFIENHIKKKKKKFNSIMELRNYVNIYNDIQWLMRDWVSAFILVC